MARIKNSPDAPTAPEELEQDQLDNPGDPTEAQDEQQPPADELEQDHAEPKDGFRTYRVVGEYVTIPSGRLRISVAQAINRSHALGGIPENTKLLKDGDEFEVLKPIGFRTDEVFAYDGELSKAQAREVVASDEGHAS